MSAAPPGIAGAISGYGDRQHVLTIGNFDGVHRGHQHLLHQVTSLAERKGATSLVVTFEPHPIAVLRPEQAPPRITTPQAKIDALKGQGIDEILVIPFDREFASLSPGEFLRFLADGTCPVDILVGDGFRFGKLRAGDFGTLREFASARNLGAHSVSPLVDDEGVISSSRIRKALVDGEVEVAAGLLGRRYRLAGTVEHGMARGRDLGYPTANLQISETLCLPRDGIYVGYAHLDERSNGPRQAMIYIGASPTFGDRKRLVEVNILDYRGDLYSQDLEIEFVAFVRGDRTFENAELLMEQMAKDETTSRLLLATSVSEDASKGD